MPAAPSAASLRTALALALATAVSLGLARFSYPVLLPPMRADLGWTYLTGGAMNTLNALGYLVGALMAPMWLRRLRARHVLIGSTLLTAALLVAHSVVTSDAWLFTLRALTGWGSAGTFVSGGLMAARLASQPGVRPGLVLGIYYGGAGAGIVASALLAAPLAARTAPHAWQGAWLALGVLGLLATVAIARGTRSVPEVAVVPAGASTDVAPLSRFAPGLASYVCFGLGYIGYMTFNVTLLREQQASEATVVMFYALLGVATMASSWIWAGLLQRHRGGRPMAILNGLLAAATVLPVLSAHPVAVFASGALFGAVFLSVVASTTALVRHNAPPAAWSRGISAFTIAFAAGQIAGPSAVGWVADSGAGLGGGLAASAAVLLLASALAVGQRALSLADPPAVRGTPP